MDLQSWMCIWLWWVLIRLEKLPSCIVSSMTNMFVSTVPTVGFNCEKVKGTIGKARGMSFIIWDVGGQDKVPINEFIVEFFVL